LVKVVSISISGQSIAGLYGGITLG